MNSANTLPSRMLYATVTSERCHPLQFVSAVTTCHMCHLQHDLAKHLESMLFPNFAERQSSAQAILATSNLTAQADLPDRPREQACA